MPELTSGVESLRRRKTHVVDVQRVRHHELRLAEGAIPVRQVVSVGIRVVDESAVLCNESVCVRAAASEIPAEWTRPRQFLVNLYSPFQVLSLHLLLDELVVDPAVAVSGDLPLCFLHRLD